MSRGVELMHMGGEVWPRLTEIAAQFKARLAGAGQQRPAHMVQRGGYARKVFRVDRVVFAAIDMPATSHGLIAATNSA